jgi:hypothetical protein
MTLSELLQYLNDNSGYVLLDGDAEETLAKARAGSHPNSLAGEIIGAIAHHCGCDSAQCAVERAQVVSAVGPVRLKYMADDAPVEGFRMVERVVQAVDGAFNEEALRNR